MIPPTSSGSTGSERLIEAAIWASWVCPVSPYTSAIPKRRNAEAKEPSSRYLTAASWERSSWRENPLRM